MREKHWLFSVYAPIRTEPATQARALTRNRTGVLLVYGIMPNQLSYTVRGFLKLFLTAHIKFLEERHIKRERSLEKIKFL